MQSPEFCPIARDRAVIDLTFILRYTFPPMFIFIVLSIIAAFMFHKETKEKGYISPRFWMYPLIVGNGLMLFAMAIKWMVAEFFSDQSSPLMKAYGPLVDVMVLIVFFMIIAKAWKQIKNLPSRGE